MNKDMIEKIHNYWSKYEIGREMIESVYVSDSDLLFLIPNNKKKILGLPLTRVNQKNNKKRYKTTRRGNFYSFRVFDIIENLVEKLLKNELDDGRYFEDFIDV